MRSPSTAVGMTMARKTSAASTSTNVKPLGRGLAPERLESVGSNLILQAACVLSHPHHGLVAPAEDDQLRAAGADEAVRGKANLGYLCRQSPWTAFPYRG